MTGGRAPVAGDGGVLTPSVPLVVGPDLILAADAAVAVLLLLGLLLLAVVLRRRLLQRRGGTVDCSLRLRPGLARAWLGARAGALRRRPAGVVPAVQPRPPPPPVPARAVTSPCVRQREPQGAESLALPSGALVLECRAGGRPRELAMHKDAAMGFLAWMESSPPGVRTVDGATG